VSFLSGKGKVMYEELEFEVIREPWNEYELPDHSILKTKHVLTRVFRKVTNGEVGYEFDTQSITRISFVPEEVKGKPAERDYAPEELRSSIIDEDVKYVTRLEEWNEYILDDGTKLKLKFTVSKVSKTDKFDRRGEPIYIVEYAMLARAIPRKKSLS
jgi:hypothetical protein